MILTLKRDDGQRLELSWLNGYSTEASDDWFTAKPMTNSTVDYANADGGMLIKQNYGMWPITISGSVHADSIKQMRDRTQALARFLLKNHYYTAIFTECDGEAMASHEAFVSTSPAITMRGKNEMAQKYSFQITLSDPYLYQYSEDAEGNETYANQLQLRQFIASEGGYASGKTGYVYYAGGYVYVGAQNQPNPVNIIGVKPINPVWIIPGPVTNPSLSNMTNNLQLSVNATIPAGQILVVDSANQTAYVGTADFTRFVVGEWMTLEIGNNLIKFEADDEDGNATSSLNWNEVLR